MTTTTESTDNQYNPDSLNKPLNVPNYQSVPHTSEVYQLLQEAADKRVIEYSDAPTNPNHETVKLSREGHQLYKELYPDKKESSENPIDLSKQPLQAGMLTVSDSTLITRSDQEHVVVAIVNEKLIGVGILTSKEYGTVKIADKQPSGAKKFDGTPKPQSLFVFREPYEIPKESFEKDNEVTAFVQDPAVTAKIALAIEPIAGFEPPLYNPVGITEEDILAMIALQEIEHAEDAIKKEKKMSHLTKNQKKNIEKKRNEKGIES